MHRSPVMPCDAVREHSTYIAGEAAVQLSILVCLVTTFLVVSVLMLLNCLIALMAKTFDDVYEKNQLELQFHFARVVCRWRDTPTVPAPLRVLSGTLNPPRRAEPIPTTAGPGGADSWFLNS